MSFINAPSYVNANRLLPLLSWKDALNILEATDAKGIPIPFAITFCTADEARKTGGEIVTYDRAIWHVAGGRVRLRPRAKEAQPKRARHQVSPNSRWLRLVRAVDSVQVRRVHVHLILSINKQPVR